MYLHIKRETGVEVTPVPCGVIAEYDGVILHIEDNNDGSEWYVNTTTTSRISLIGDGGCEVACLFPNSSQMPVALSGGVRELERESAEAAREKPEEEAPAEPTLREFLVEFRKWLAAQPMPSVETGKFVDWLDDHLGKEKSDG